MDFLKSLLGAFKPGQPTQPEPADTIKPAPTEKDPLAEQWNKRVTSARKHWHKFHQRVRHNRATVAGFDWSKDPKAKDFYTLRANLIHGTITAMLPNIYARNPEISASPTYNAPNLKLFCKTLEKVTNRYLEKAQLKARAKSTVRSAMTTSFGVVKVMYQRDIRKDPIIAGRINDTQDNIAAIEGLMAEIEDPDQRADLEAKKAELDQLMRSLNERAEVTAAEGLVIDRILTENLLIDPSVVEFTDYPEADWMAQVIPMKKGEAERFYNVKLDGARAYVEARSNGAATNDGRFASAKAELAEDVQIAVIEVWDKTTQTIYTFAEGCNFWLREPYTPPKAGERWYPFFLLPYQLVDGEFVAPSLVDLTEKLQDEHNQARDRFNKHRDLAIPGWIASGDTDEKALKNYAKSVSVEGFGEIAIIDTDGKPLRDVILPKQHPPIDPAVYDVSGVRTDWEQVTGLQDAMRSTVVQPKTATEASIQQQGLAGRTGEFRDQTEDWLQEISQYSAQILLLELTEAQVQRIMGQPEVVMVDGPMGPMQTEKKPYDWPTLARDQVYDLIDMKIRAGTTGAPDKAEQQESWGKVLPVIQGLVLKIMELRSMGADVMPLENLMRETIRRFDERLEVEDFLPKAPAMPAMPPGLPAPGGPSLPAGEDAMPVPPMDDNPAQQPGNSPITLPQL